MNAISIAPSVENPIIRKPVREDIYVKAAQFRMINTPGSIIEDRQYELLLKNISVFTGNWDEILQFTCPANVINNFIHFLEIQQLTNTIPIEQFTNTCHFYCS